MSVDQTAKQTPLFIITGYSGAGKSTVLRSLEDIGFFCVDNLPLALLPSFFQFAQQAHSNNQKIALGLDVRAGDIDVLAEQLARFNQTYCLDKIIFLTASSPMLFKRFQETRRRHPLGESLDLVDAIEREKELLKPLEKIADITVDTDQFTIHELRTFARKYIGSDKKQPMIVSLVSFGFKYGVPIESNFVFDLRSLPNPYFIPELKLLDGSNKQVQDYLFSQREVQEYWKRFFDFFQYSLERSYQEGRFFMHVALGCTGGRHRSVAFVQELANHAIDHVEFLIKHRDIAKDLQQ
jgi:RNase adapter protein RapZ